MRSCATPQMITARATTPTAPMNINNPIITFICSLIKLSISSLPRSIAGQTGRPARKAAKDLCFHISLCQPRLHHQTQVWKCLSCICRIQIAGLVSSDFPLSHRKDTKSYIMIQLYSDFFFDFQFNLKLLAAAGALKYSSTSCNI